MAVAMVLGRDGGWERSRGAGGDSEHGQGAASQQSQQWSINCSGNCSSRMGMHGAEQKGKKESRGIHCICTKSLCFLGVFNDFYAAVSEVKPVLHIHWHGPQHLLLSGHSELHVRPVPSPGERAETPLGRGALPQCRLCVAFTARDQWPCSARAGTGSRGLSSQAGMPIKL